MEDLITWLRAQIAEDDRAAGEASPGPWTAKRADRSVYAVETSFVMGGHDGAWYVVPYQAEGGEGIDPGDAAHIARWDPALATALTTALRSILDEFQWEAMETRCVRVLACALYGGRDGWREEWRPSW